ncbi:MAG TPA: phosphoribosylanthranilate isomerase [Candidatus Competibacteraceae bacterium]|nr:phosphoribosylanthranilate isomerase [Candidatus Competibacteraceae bacterium]
MNIARRTRIKICGITRPEDGQAAARLGADAIGLVFYPPSPRAVDAERAAAIVTALPPFVSAVGLFVDAEPEWVRAVLARVPLALLQFHGAESADYCRGFGRPYLKAVPMGGGARVEDYQRRYPDAAGLLLDSHGGGKSGGSGRAFDWAAIPAPAARTLPLVLAGGLDADNVAAAVAQVHPYAVDVSSGVETAKGIKDEVRMARFVAAVAAGERAA